MAVDASEVVVGASGTVSVAPAGTAVPTDLTALAAAWINVGYISEDGITFTGGSNVEDVNAWQSFYPIRKIITGRSAGVEFVMRQWNGENLKLAFGGGQVVTATGGKTYFAPPSPSQLDIRAMVIDWQDGSENYRLVIPRGIVSGDTSTQVVRQSAADLPVSFAAAPNTVQTTLSATPTAAELATQPWFLVTDTTSFTT